MSVSLGKKNLRLYYENKFNHKEALKKKNHILKTLLVEGSNLVVHQQN